jgi:hypothetical protein
MWSKNILFFALLMAFIVFMDSCGKSGLSYTGSQIATKYDYKSEIFYTYNYNSNGTIFSITQNVNGSNYFTYVHDSVLQEDKNIANVTQSGMLYWTNTVGLADSATGLGQLRNNSWGYTYDANYFPMQINYYTYNKLTNIDYYSIIGKNIGSIEHLDSTNHTFAYDYFTYFPSNSNTLGNQAIGENFLGVQNANLIQYDIVIKPVGGNLDTTDIIKYNYRYDTSGRPDTVAIYHRNGLMIDSAIYTYTD